MDTPTAEPAAPPDVSAVGCGRVASSGTGGVIVRARDTGTVCAASDAPGAEGRCGPSGNVCQRRSGAGRGLSAVPAAAETPQTAEAENQARSATKPTLIAL